MDCISHGAQIGTDVYGVGDKYQGDDPIEEPRRIMATKVSGDAMTRRPTYAGADLLDGRHQRERQKHRPADREAELCTRLAIGPDPRWVVVRGPRDQTGPQGGQ